MTLLEEIIEGASGNAADLPTLLRRCKVLVARLGSKSAEDWLEFELEGYPGEVTVPPYRVLPMQLRGNFIGELQRADNYAIPRGQLPENVRDRVLDTIDYRQSVSAIEHLLQSADGAGTNFNVPLGNLALALHYEIFPDMQCTGAWGVVGSAHLAAVVGTVRNRILNMSLALWKEMPEAGTASARAPEEVEMRATQIINNHIYGPANVVGTNHSNVTLNVTQGDFTSLRQALESNGVPSRDMEALKSALDEEPQATSGSFGPKVSLWFGKMMKKAADGSWKVGVSVAGNVLSKAISKYYGLA